MPTGYIWTDWSNGIAMLENLGVNAVGKIQLILNNIGCRDDDPLHVKKIMYKFMVNH